MKSMFKGIYIQKGYSVLDICKNSVIVQLLLTTKEDCVLVEKLRKLQRVVHTCCVRCVPSDLKRTEKYRSLNGT